MYVFTIILIVLGVLAGLCVLEVLPVPPMWNKIIIITFIVTSLVVLLKR